MTKNALESSMAGFAASLKAARYCADAVTVFQAACAMGDWGLAEEARAKAIAATETYLDELMTAYRASMG